MKHFGIMALVPAAFASAAAATAPEGAPLTLDEATRLAVTAQPLLDSQRATVRAARERAVAMRQLPDPMLVAAVQNLPVNGEDRYNLSMDPMTMTGIGFMQEVPLPAKRRLRGRAESLMADAGDQKLAMLERSVRRDAATAWVEVWFAERSAERVAALAIEAEREHGAANIAYRAGRVPQTDVLAADVEVEMLRDRASKLAQDAAQARARLARWVGRPVAAVSVDAPSLPQPPALPALLAGLDRHPELREAHLEIETARNAVALAEEMYWPDWRIEAMYGWRQEYDEMVTLQLGIDLPVFRGKRQNRETGAARAELAEHEATHAGHQRELGAMVTAGHAAWSTARERLERYDEAIVPRSNARAEAALAAYRSGKAELMDVIGARRGALEASLMRLELQMEMLKAQIDLQYLNGQGE